LQKSWNVALWLRWIGEFAPSPAQLENLALQGVLIVAVLALSWIILLVTRSLTDRLFARVGPYLHVGDRRLDGLRPLVPLAYAWLLLVVAERTAPWFGLAAPILGIAATLAALWIVLRATTLMFRDAPLARLVAMAAWVFAALDITGMLSPTAAALDSAALTIGTLRLSLLLLIKAALITAVLLWAALALSRLIAGRLQHLTLSPSVQTLTGNIVKVVLVCLALLIGLTAVGIDLTALAVFSGAIGVGIGLGLQKIVSNFVSGIVLLIEQSIKPGDVIEVRQTYGTVASLGARHASVRGRDGREYLIPNETLITNEVVNWSYWSPLRRLDVRFGVGYASDLRQVRLLATAAAVQTNRVLAEPAAVCHITEFGDNAVNLVLRFWIEDPANGVANVTGDVFLALWDAFREHNIELPFPQREIRVRDLSTDLPRPAPTPRPRTAE
jgi:small-conductance mechanosensitive channel